MDQCEPEPPTVPAAELFSNEVPSPYDGTSSPPPPRNVDPSLWRTFHRELTERTRTLEDLLRQASSQERRDETVRQLARVLHTIKSASMVVPVEQVTRCTHLAESLVEKWQGGEGPRRSGVARNLRRLAQGPRCRNRPGPSDPRRVPALEIEMNAYLS